MDQDTTATAPPATATPGAVITGGKPAPRGRDIDELCGAEIITEFGIAVICSALPHGDDLWHAAYADGQVVVTWPTERAGAIARCQPADASRAAYTAGLRMLADALEQHPELPLPYEGRRAAMRFHFLSAADPRAAMAAAARALPCALAEQLVSYGDAPSDNYLDLTGELAGLRVALTAYRDDVPGGILAPAPAAVSAP